MWTGHAERDNAGSDFDNLESLSDFSQCEWIHPICVCTLTSIQSIHGPESGS